MRDEIVFTSVIIVIFLAGFAFGFYFQGPQVNFPSNNATIHQQEEFKPLEEYKIYSQVKTKLVAVDQEGNGVVTNLTVRAVPGNGKVLVDVRSLLFWIDTQQSIQLAREVAEDYLGEKAKNLDLTYTIDIPNATLVGGPSAGAAFTVATIAVLEDKKLRNDTIITGTIEDNGTIGKVGGILAKAQAAKKEGYKRFLLPEGQGKFTEYRKEEKCENYGSLRFCNVMYRPVTVDVEKEIGIDVIEVSNIDEAVKYSLGD